jgi:hypothetical protein
MIKSIVLPLERVPRATREAGIAHERTILIIGKMALVLVLPAIGSAAHAAVFVLLAVWALLGPRRAIEALTLSWLASFLTPGLYTPTPAADVLRWVVIAAAFTSVSIQTVKSGGNVPRAWLWVVGFVGVATVLAVPVSYAIDVSLFKLASFLMGATAVLLGFHLTRMEASHWHRWFVCLFAVVVITGLPLIAHPLGYVRNERGFQGLLNHPQAYTTFLGPLLAWHVARLITRETRGGWMWLLAALATISLIATQGRTGVIAAGAGLSIATLWWVASGRVRLAVTKQWIGMGLLCCTIGTGFVAMKWDHVAAAAAEFAVKGQLGKSIGESFHGSRGVLLERSIANFQLQPLTGIGFGVASDPETFIIRRDPLLGLPVGASTEKGFTVVAVLEEVGVIGFVAFLAMLLALVRPAFTQRASFASAVLMASALVVNFGEAVLFAFGGSGILVWLLIGMARVPTAWHQ